MHRHRPVTLTRFSRLCLTIGTLGSIAAFGLSGQAAWADAACTPPSNGPTGSDAPAFTYQCSGTYAGDWANSYYVYNPTTGVETPLYSPDYSYNCAAGIWTKANWSYDATSGAYVENRVAATAPPDQATNCAATDSNNTTSANAGSGSASAGPVPDPSSTGTSTPVSPAVATAPPDPNVTCPTPGTLAPADGTANGVATSGINVNNTVCSQSQSGDASVTKNGQAGNATSGNSTTEVDAANLVNSTSSASGSGVLTFHQDIYGNKSGDLVLDPSTLGTPTAGTDPSDTAGVVGTNVAINNTITATAVSGDATVSGNGKAGDATTGDAEAIVNLINMINSAVAAGQSFVGTINVYGDLNGNILVPQSVIDQILASNAAGDPGAGITSFNSNESIINNVNASATSGNATVSNNWVGGNATSGSASTNVTILNLTGSSVIGKNVLLVFVNVLGQWVGVILGAPTGTTSAEFGGGIASSTPGTGNSVVAADTSLSITNNVNASATSGNATVSNNWVGGNATSGSASTAVNILNVENSTLSLANWFGILFINVFGTWNGNFGIYTPPAPAVSTTPVDTEGDGIATTAFAAVHHTPIHLATFIPSSPNNSPDGTVAGSATTAVLGSAITTPTKPGSTASASTNSNTHANYTLPAMGVFLAILLLAAAERDRIFHRGKN